LDYLEDPWRKVYNTDVLDDTIEALHERQVLRILLQVVLSLFFILEFDHKAMREAALSGISNGRMTKREGNATT